MTRSIGFIVLCLGLVFSALQAQDSNLQTQERIRQLEEKLRCLVCQNQTIADSHAPLAIDLRQQVREMLQAGQTEAQITDYMTARYGDFVLYRPPFRATTAFLWIGPGVMALAGMATLFIILRRRSRMDAQQFDPDEPEAVQDRHLS